MRNPPTAIHEDKELNDEWWALQGCSVVPDRPIKLPGAPIEIYRNYIRDASGRYDGYVFVYDDNRKSYNPRTTAQALACLKEFLSPNEAIDPLEPKEDPPKVSTFDGAAHFKAMVDKGVEEIQRREDAEWMAQVKNILDSDKGLVMPKEYIFASDRIYPIGVHKPSNVPPPIGLVRHHHGGCMVEKDTLVCYDVKQTGKLSWSFKVRGFDGAVFETHYQWALVENTPANIEGLRRWRAQQLVTEQSQAAANKLHDRLVLAPEGKIDESDSA